jgi:hypothetical protein
VPRPAEFVFGVCPHQRLRLAAGRAPLSALAAIQPEMNIQGFKPEPIAIPVASGPSGMDLQLSASGCDLADALDSARCYPSCAADGASGSVDPKAAARQLDSDRLIASLANSEIQPDELQMVCSIGHGSSGNVSQVLHMPAWP